eukprot:gene8032-9436_t
MFTLNDLDSRKEYEKESKLYFASVPTAPSSDRSKVHTIGNTLRDPETIGRKALELTNAFRAKQKKPPLQWHQALYTIGVEHSKNMSDKKVPFGHDGFDDRCKRFPFRYKKAGENVAMNNSDAAVAEVSVDGWIESKGHRENLLGAFNICAIGVYQGNDGLGTQIYVGWGVKEEFSVNRIDTHNTAQRWVLFRRQGDVLWWEWRLVSPSLVSQEIFGFVYAYLFTGVSENSSHYQMSQRMQDKTTANTNNYSQLELEFERFVNSAIPPVHLPNPLNFLTVDLLSNIQTLSVETPFQMDAVYDLLPSLRNLSIQELPSFPSFHFTRLLGKVSLCRLAIKEWHIDDHDADPYGDFIEYLFRQTTLTSLRVHPYAEQSSLRFFHQELESVLWTKPRITKISTPHVIHVSPSVTSIAISFDFHNFSSIHPTFKHYAFIIHKITLTTNYSIDFPPLQLSE